MIELEIAIERAMKFDSSGQGRTPFTAGTQMMHSGHIFGVDDLMARPPNPSAELRFFEKEEEAFVESTDFLYEFGANQKDRSAHRLDASQA